VVGDTGIEPVTSSVSTLPVVQLRASEQAILGRPGRSAAWSAVRVVVSVVVSRPFPVVPCRSPSAGADEAPRWSDSTAASAVRSHWARRARRRATSLIRVSVSAVEVTQSLGLRRRLSVCGPATPPRSPSHYSFRGWRQIARDVPRPGVPVAGRGCCGSGEREFCYFLSVALLGGTGGVEAAGGTSDFPEAVAGDVDP
jgi:hypothetical protein